MTHKSFVAVVSYGLLVTHTCFFVGVCLCLLFLVWFVIRRTCELWTFRDARVCLVGFVVGCLFLLCICVCFVLFVFLFVCVLCFVFVLCLVSVMRLLRGCFAWATTTVQ